VGSLEQEFAMLQSSNPLAGGFPSTTGMIKSNINKAPQSIANAAYAAGYVMTAPEQVYAMQLKLANSLERSHRAYINGMAIANPKKFHHVYEPNHTGQTAYRLFDLIVADKRYQSTMKLQLRYRPSKMLTPVRQELATPGKTGKFVKRRHKFPDRAMAFEYGKSLNIKPKGNGKFLVFFADGKIHFLRLKSVTIDTRKQATFGAMSAATRAYFEGPAKATAAKAYERQVRKAKLAGSIAALRGIQVNIPSSSVAKSIGRSVATEVGLK